MKTPSIPPALTRSGLLLGLLLHTTMAVAGDGVVGTATLELENKATGRKVASELWFKTAPDARIEWLSPRLPLR
jgi:hypothetical protein